MKTNPPPVYKADHTIRQTPDIIAHERAKDGNKSKARYPHKPLGIVPGGSADTKGSFKRALTPGTSPSGS